VDLDKTEMETTTLTVKQIWHCISLKYAYDEIILLEFPGEDKEQPWDIRKKELEELSTLKAAKEILVKALDGDYDNIEFSPIAPNVTAHQILNPEEYYHDNSDW